MGQTEIYEYLKKKRVCGEDRFFTIKEVETHLADLGQNPKNTGTKLLKLYNHGYLEIRVKPLVKGRPWHGWNRKYRIKEKYKNGF